MGKKRRNRRTTPETSEEHHRRQTAPSLEKSEPEGTARRLRASNSIKKGGTHMAYPLDISLDNLKERDIMDKYIPESTTHDLKVMGL